MNNLEEREMRRLSKMEGSLSQDRSRKSEMQMTSDATDRIVDSSSDTVSFRGPTGGSSSVSVLLAAVDQSTSVKLNARCRQRCSRYFGFVFDAGLALELDCTLPTLNLILTQ